MPRDTAQRVPPISPLMWRWFTWYARRFLRKHFHAVRLMRGSEPPTIPLNEPLIVYCNHPSWWDPMIGIFLAHRLWPDRQHYWPIDAAMLKKYPLFAKVGFFGVRKNSTRGGATFMRTAIAVLAQDRACLWITAQGEFADVRTRPVRIRRGLPQLTARLERGIVLPLAGEYPFWTERTPEALLRFGLPLSVGEHPSQERLESALTSTMDELAMASVARDALRFQTLLHGACGTSAFYDAWRRAKASLAGRGFDASHAEVNRRDEVAPSVRVERA